MSNPHRISIFLILLLFLGLIFVAVSDLLSFHEDDFDLSEALVQVQVQTPRHYDSSDVEEPVNYLLASKRRIHSCDPFTADEATVYYVPSECFDAYIDRAQNKVLNRLVSVAVTDGNGTPLEVPAVLPDIFAQIATLEHDLKSSFFGPDKIPAHAITSGEKYPTINDVVQYVKWQNATPRCCLSLRKSCWKAWRVCCCRRNEK